MDFSDVWQSSLTNQEVRGVARRKMTAEKTVFFHRRTLHGFRGKSHIDQL